MKSIEVNGKTVEDAVKSGLRELGKESSEVTIDVLEYGSPGLFGMFGKLARVRLTVKEPDPELDFEMPVFSLDQEPPKSQKPKAEAPKPAAPKAAEKRPEPRPVTKPEPVKSEPVQKPAAPVEEKSGRPERAEESAQAERAPRSRRPRSRKPCEGQPPREERAEKPEPMKLSVSMEDLPAVDPDALTSDEKNAYDFIRELTRLMNVDVEVRVKTEGNALRAQMIGDTLGVLIGRRGETLDALQYLTSLQVNKGREEYLRVTLDTEHYRAKREEALIRLAERMANRARRTGHRVSLEPMNPYERRVLHSALQNHPYVVTHSEGEEPYRRVIITLK